MRGWKTIETRTHNRFSCLNDKIILIHAGLKTDADARNNPYLTQKQLLYNPDEMVNGYILGSVHVNKIMSLNDDHSEAALINCHTEYSCRFGLFLDSVKKFDTPIPVKGEMGIWYFDMDKKRKVKKTTTQTTIF